MYASVCTYDYHDFHATMVQQNVHALFENCNSISKHSFWNSVEKWMSYVILWDHSHGNFQHWLWIQIQMRQFQVTEIGWWAKWRWPLLYTAILRSHADSLHSHVILHEWLAFYRASFECPPRWHVWCHMKLRTWTWSVCTIQPCTLSLHDKVMKSRVMLP